MKKSPKLNEKTGKKTQDLINKKSLKLKKKTRGKIDCLCFVQYFVQCIIEDKKPSKLS